MKLSDTKTQDIHVSVVSHGQAALVLRLLQDIEKHCRRTAVHVTVTINVPEPFDTHGYRFSFPVRFLQNPMPQGFAANHNTAFRHGLTEYPSDYFCVVNPDIRLMANPFPGLLRCLEQADVGVAAPLVLNVQGGVEDSARRFPTPFRILAKALGMRGQPDYPLGQEVTSPNWVAGMFMLIPTATFRRLGGFDERYFLYYEDVDLCARMQLAGKVIRLCPEAKVIHEARRQSHRDFRYLRWHVASMLRFFLSKPFFRILWRRRLGRKP